MAKVCKKLKFCFFFSPLDCMCNGHSACTKDSKSCDQPCLDNTEGEHCEKCAQGYFGVPVNGGECEGKYDLQ